MPLKSNSRCKKEQLSTKRPYWKMLNQNGHWTPPVFDRLEVLFMMTSLQNVILCAEGLLLLLGSKFLIQMTKLQNIKIKRTMFCNLVIFIKNFDLIHIKRPWTPKITISCSEIIVTKTFKPIKSRRPWLPI